MKKLIICLKDFFAFLPLYIIIAVFFNFMLYVAGVFYFLKINPIDFDPGTRALAKQPD